MTTTMVFISRLVRFPKRLLSALYLVWIDSYDRVPGAHATSQLATTGKEILEAFGDAEGHALFDNFEVRRVRQPDGSFMSFMREIPLETRRKPHPEEVGPNDRDEQVRGRPVIAAVEEVDLPDAAGAA